jgi:hypothetical protein
MLPAQIRNDLVNSFIRTGLDSVDAKLYAPDNNFSDIVIVKPSTILSISGLAKVRTTVESIRSANYFTEPFFFY